MVEEITNQTVGKKRTFSLMKGIVLLLYDKDYLLRHLKVFGVPSILLFSHNYCKCPSKSYLISIAFESFATIAFRGLQHGRWHICRADTHAY